ncbi:hypothetical protein DKX38_002320 [Salix brachista]|uniref:Uncharacterized protein n=1 Tax=Salix brachista TaxID=2182728 RepID=A0A5N5NNC7_9ROSI|nr:hypothetical protein DKX38_002320 [Salix brachista]
MSVCLTTQRGLSFLCFIVAFVDSFFPATRIGVGINVGKKEEKATPLLSNPLVYGNPVFQQSAASSDLPLRGIPFSWSSTMFIPDDPCNLFPIERRGPYKMASTATAQDRRLKLQGFRISQDALCFLDPSRPPQLYANMGTTTPSSGREVRYGIRLESGR